MEKESGNQDQVTFMKEITLMTLNMDLAPINGKMESYILVDSKMVTKLTEINLKKKRIKFFI